jgi:hypothetical protein
MSGIRPLDAVQGRRFLTGPKEEERMMRRRIGRGALATLVLAAALGTAEPARAELLEDAGWGTLTMLTNVLYMPAKITYAVLGGLTGGLTYALTAGDSEAANTVWTTTLGGNYVVTPAMLRGEETFMFAGTPGHESTADAASGSGELGDQPLSDS